jgi:hypothetical protein
VIHQADRLEQGAYLQPDKVHTVVEAGT